MHNNFIITKEENIYFKNTETCIILKFSKGEEYNTFQFKLYIPKSNESSVTLSRHNMNRSRRRRRGWRIPTNRATTIHS